MLFAQLVIESVPCTAWVLTKYDVAALTLLGKNTRAPADEQAVRFTVWNGNPVVWATDATHLLWVETLFGKHPSDVNLHYTAKSLKAAAPKKAKDTLLITTCGKAYLQLDGGPLMSVELADPGPCEVGPQHWASVANMVRDDLPPLGGRWRLDASAIDVLAAVSKACVGEVVTIASPPTSTSSPFVAQVTNDLDRTRWTLAVMPHG